METPVIVENNGIKLHPEKMIKEELYYCIYQDHIFLFYKDNDEVLHCYEISDVHIINQIKRNPENIDKILNDLTKDQSTDVST